MKRSFLFLAIVFFFSLKLFSQSDYYMSIYFNAGKYQLLETDQNKLNHFIEQLNPSQKAFIIEGYTSDEGSESSNFNLAAKRINSVTEYLKSKGVDISKAEIINWGETNPTYLKSNDNMRTMNRRVDILIPEYIESKEVVTVADIFNLFGPKIQEFCIRNDQDTAVEALNGSILYFPANSFNEVDVKECECITIKVEELFSKSAIAMATASTITSDEILESKGMLNVTANCNDKELELADGKRMSFVLPNADDLEGLGVFYGDRDSNGNLIWAAANDGIDIGRLNLSMIGNCSVYNSDTSKKKCWFRYSKAKKKELLRFYKQVRDSLAYCQDVTSEQKELMDKYGIDDLDQLRDKIEENANRNGAMDGDDADYYILSALRLGYINADWIMKLDRSKLVTIKIPVKNTQNVKAYLVFDKNRTVVPASLHANMIAFGNMPIGYGAKIFAIRDNNKSAAEWAWQEFEIGADNKINLEFKPADLNEIKLKLYELDNK